MTETDYLVEQEGLDEQDGFPSGGGGFSMSRTDYLLEQEEKEESGGLPVGVVRFR